jgi:hypothetical protein
MLGLASRRNCEAEAREDARIEREVCPQCGSRQYKMGGGGKKDKFLSYEFQLLKIAEEYFYLRCGSNAEGSI